MKKNLFVMWGCGITVIALTCVCMVLLFAEPAECDSWKQFMLTFAAIKVAAIVCGVVAVWLAGELTHKGWADNSTNGTEENNL